MKAIQIKPKGKTDGLCLDICREEGRKRGGLAGEVGVEKVKTVDGAFSTRGLWHRCGKQNMKILIPPRVESAARNETSGAS